MLKFHPIIAFMKRIQTSKNIFGQGFLVKYIFRIQFKIPILDLMFCQKTVFHLKGNNTVVESTLLADVTGVSPNAQLRTCIIKIVTFNGGHLMW